ncbi:P-loop containing nucleoside triphosphate hydrolase protein [Flagelloscypha sp. PMI_526]|nr:P-loop containing nucleoside triphosphate hydrolase protein [Flagelloscypha sp. PMI_526]
MSPTKPMTDDDDFVNVWNSNPGQPGRQRDFYKLWIEEASASYTCDYEMLKKYFPNHSIEDSPLLTNVSFIPGQRRQSKGFLVDSVKFGGFRLAWDKYDFILYIVTWPVARLFLEAGAWFNELHEEVWVFDQGYWQKDHALWLDVQKGDWDEVILKPEFKQTIQQDIYGFWKAEKVYKELGVPWKRGIIMHGPPGNGKTISLKAIMKDCQDKGFIPVYVKSLQSWMGEEAAMSMIFAKARELAPSVIIFEDIDSLINDGNRSYFLNQVDGLTGNDGLLLASNPIFSIGTTNHFERLDPGLSSRPSRFDRKYLFDDPDRQERRLYCRFWQKKLSSNKDVDYSDDLAWEVADLTSGFSFAYLKEAHVAALVTLAGGDSKSFEVVVKTQIEDLRKQITKEDQSEELNQKERNIRLLLDSLSETVRWSDPKSNRIYQTGRRNEKDVRALLDTLAEHTSAGGTNAEAILSRLLDPSRPPSAYDGNVGGRDIRVLLDALQQKAGSNGEGPKIFDLVPPSRAPATNATPASKPSGRFRRSF